ncbi:hypothetical protein [Escherichia phage vB_EcoS_PHB17]|uniref:Uncharacterized protein n=1 Tax=Escherichia phage vB_EcoS_PHB17 TaxID=2591407 RepID=A0A514DKP5_9CAUD|nr:hypothetical protein KMB84_gp16 [Escherichia phage vB_EcoS_PHB17]QDH94219.1 hypothetical protein [Escherichia phage vB_EcoS_PHB17]
MWNWKKLLLTVFLALLGSTLIEGFTNFLGALVMAIAYSIPSYYDGKKAGGREVFELIKRK